MNKIGRKNTVLLSLAVTIISLLLPIFGETFGLMLVSFSLLGIGNALMQTSLNPLVSTVMEGGNLASTLTFGQFVKAIASFMAPYIAMWGAQACIPSFGLEWRVLFPIYMIIGVVATVLLFSTRIEESTISYVGYKTQVLQPKATMEIQMVEDNVLAEMVVTGYTVQRKADLTGAVSVMDMKKPQSEGSPNLINSMQGRLPGVNIVTDPAPGGGSSSIQIRGMSNFNGNNSPLYIVDGIATTENLNSLNPADIESV